MIFITRLKYIHLIGAKDLHKNVAYHCHQEGKLIWLGLGLGFSGILRWGEGSRDMRVLYPSAVFPGENLSITSDQ